MRQLRNRAFGRMYRRLQRSVTLTPRQRAAITRRQQALGILPPRAAKADDSHTHSQSQSKSHVMAPSDAHTSDDDASYGTGTDRGAGRVAPTPGGAPNAAAAQGPPRVPAVAYAEVKNDEDYVSVESDESDKEDPVGDLDIDDAWMGVRAVWSRGRGGGRRTQGPDRVPTLMSNVSARCWDHVGRCCIPRLCTCFGRPLTV